ncbi:MAG: CRISPR-associated endonuclease Cas2 [Geminicoccaceae bacterium]
MAEMLMVFTYDIAANRARRKVAEMLEERCVRVQKSVFETRMRRADAHKLARKLARQLSPGDSLRVYAITAQGLEKSLAYGPVPLPEDQDFYLL